MRDTLIGRALELSAWRQAYNQDVLGRGVDPFQPDTPHDYAEAWALWGRGYARLYRLTRDRFHLATAERAAEWLLEHPNPGYQRPSWGLPWPWERWSAPVTLSYLITTVLVGDLLLELYQTTGKALYLRAAQDVADWILEENGGECQEGLWRLHYANHPGLTFPVVNPTAKASGLLAGLYHATHEERYRTACWETAAWVCAQQRADGAWRYSDQGDAIDNVHTGFTLEGLWTAHGTCNRPEIRRAAARGTRFYWRRCFQPSGRGLEQALSGWGDLGRVPPKAWLRDRLAPFGRLPRPLPETRAHGYASALRVFALASGVQPEWSKRANQVYAYVQTHLAQPDGSYAFRAGDARTFIRHQAHLFDALACLAERLDE